MDWKHIAAVVVGALLMVASAQLPGFKDAVCSAGGAPSAQGQGK